MRKMLLIAASLLLSTSQLLAQQNDNKDKSNGRQFVTQGCLLGAPGALRLKTSGTTYEIVGDTAQMSDMVGKEVKVTGQEGSASDISTGLSGHTGLGTSNPTAGTAPTIKVKTAQVLSSDCEQDNRKSH